MSLEPMNPSGLCACGCGKRAPRSIRTQGRYVKGERVLFLPGHHNKHGPEMCATEGCDYLHEPSEKLCWLCLAHDVAHRFRNAWRYDQRELAATLDRLEAMAE